MSDLTDEELSGFEYHGCSSGTPTPTIVRDAITRATAEIRRRRAEERAARVNLAAVGVSEDGPLDQLVCTLAGLHLELKQRQSAIAERVRKVVHAEAYSVIHRGTMRAFDVSQLADAITDRVAAQIEATAPPDLSPSAEEFIALRKALWRRLEQVQAQEQTIRDLKESRPALQISATDLDELRRSLPALLRWCRSDLDGEADDPAWRDIHTAIALLELLIARDQKAP